MNIRTRAKHPVGLRFFEDLIAPEYVGHLKLNPPIERQYILRMLVKEPFEEFKIPKELQWTDSMLRAACVNQNRMNIRQPFCYITVRHGIVNTHIDDVWHTDGFSQVITHLPEQNYIWANHTPTEYITKSIKFPSVFDTMKHNVHSYIQDSITDADKVRWLNQGVIYCIDPYFIHRRPQAAKNKARTFVRISFTPVEIYDKNNTPNPYMKRNYTRDGVKSFRDNLKNFKHKGQDETN